MSSSTAAGSACNVFADAAAVSLHFTCDAVLISGPNACHVLSFLRITSPALKIFGIHLFRRFPLQGGEPLVSLEVSFVGNTVSTVSTTVSNTASAIWDGTFDLALELELLAQGASEYTERIRLVGCGNCGYAPQTGTDVPVPKAFPRSNMHEEIVDPEDTLSSVSSSFLPAGGVAGRISRT